MCLLPSVTKCFSQLILEELHSLRTELVVCEMQNSEELKKGTLIHITHANPLHSGMLHFQFMLSEFALNVISVQLGSQQELWVIIFHVLHTHKVCDLYTVST